MNIETIRYFEEVRPSGTFYGAAKRTRRVSAGVEQGDYLA